MPFSVALSVINPHFFLLIVVFLPFFDVLYYNLRGFVKSYNKLFLLLYINFLHSVCLTSFFTVSERGSVSCPSSSVRCDPVAVGLAGSLMAAGITRYFLSDGISRLSHSAWRYGWQSLNMVCSWDFLLEVTFSSIRLLH